MIKIKEQNRHMKHIKRDVLLFGHYDMSLDEFINIFCVKVSGKLIAWDDLNRAKKYILSKWDVDVLVKTTEYGKSHYVGRIDKYIENIKYYSIKFVPNSVVQRLRSELEWVNNFVVLINEKIDKYGKSNIFIGEIVKYYGVEKPGVKLDFWTWLRALCHTHDWCMTVSGEYSNDADEDGQVISESAVKKLSSVHLHDLSTDDLEAVVAFRRSNRKKP